MFSKNTGKGGIFSRGGPALAVIGIHVAIIYVLSISMGVVEMPKFAQPLEAIFVPEAIDNEPEPVPMVKPDIPDIEQPVDEPLPQVAVDEPLAPPAENPMPASESAIAATAAAGAPAQDLKASTRIEPSYPPTSRRLGEEGQVRLKVLVDEKGRPKDIQISKGSGFERLDEAAKDAVRKWRFVAATDGSKPIAAWTQVAITFRLSNAG